MPLFSVNEYSIRPEKLRDFEQLLASVAQAAKSDAKSPRWTTHVTTIGPGGVVAIVLQSESFAERAKIETGEALVRRLFGEKKGNELLQNWLACIQGGRTTVLRDRAELSYPAPLGSAPRAYTMLTRVEAVPGGAETVEESLRKLAEAIPKTDDARRFTTLQPYFGNLREYVTVVGLDHPEQLDALVPPAELLNQAFGLAEGGLITRAGMAAMAHATRELMMLRAELSNIL